MMRRLALVTLMFLVLSCVHRRTINPQTSRLHLFPPGLYTHDVTLSLPDGRNYHFKGVLKLQEDAIHLTGLSSFSTTVFRLSEDRKSGKIQTEVFQDSLKKHEPRIRQFYAHLRTLFSLEANPKVGNSFTVVNQNSQGYPVEVQTRVDEKEVRLLFKTYDENRIPKTIEIRLPEFSVEIEVVSYEL